MKTARLTTLFALVALTFAAPTVAPATGIHTVALSGVDDAHGPGLGGGALFNATYFSSPRLVPGTPGAVVFQSGLAGTVSGSGEFIHDGASNSTVVRTGQQAPGLALGINIQTLDDLPLGASNGTVKTSVVLSGAGVTSSSDRAILIVGSGGASVIREGDSVPGLPATTLFGRFEDFGARHYGNRGALFGANLTGPGVNSSNDQALVVGQPGSLSLLSREGEQIPNMPIGANYSTGFSPNAIRGGFSGTDGVIVFGRAANGTVPTGTESVINLYQNGTYTLLARQNESTLTNRPGVFGGELFDVYPSSSETFIATGNVNDAGTLKPSLVAGNHAGELKVLVDSDTVLPGGSATLTSIREHALSINGRFAAFVAEMSDGNYGLFRYDTVLDALDKIAAQGDARPDGGSFGFLRDAAFAVNSRGQLAFTTNFSSATQIYGFNQAGVSLLVPTSIDVDEGPGTDLRTITRLNFTDAGSGSPPTFLSPDGGLVLSDEGTLVFSAQFSNGTTGIFTTNIVPEPASLALVALGTVSLITVRRRKL